MADIHYQEIKPKKNFFDFNISEIWRYRDLLYFFTLRDLKVMYKQTVLGVFWVVTQPIVTMVIFTFLFGGIAKIDSSGVPYPIFVYSGLLFWNLFSNSLNTVSMSIVSIQGMIKKIYFPRLIIPLSTIVTHSVNFLIETVIFIALAIYFKYDFSLQTIFLFAVAYVAAVISALGPGLLFAAINVQFRDVKYALPFFIRTLLFLTPVIYPIDFVEGDAKYFLAINPISSFIQILRDSMFGTHQVDEKMIIISTISAIILLVFGLLYFNRNEKEFADLV